MTPPLLSIQNLAVEFGSGPGLVRAVTDVSLQVAPGEAVGVVGESGSGKSVTALSILGLLPDAKTRGRIEFDGRDLVGLPERDLRTVRGAQIGMIFQDPMSSLNPIRSIGRQIGDVIRAHRGVTQRESLARAAELLDLVGIPDARNRLSSLPHEFSGGMRQRVMIAMALSCDPKLLIADEPTTALDVTTQAQILSLLRDLRRELGMAMLIISHDFGVIAETAQRVAVMYAGTVVEVGDVEQVTRAPHHPYTLALLESVRKLSGGRRAGRLGTIPGTPPAPTQTITGCPFANRCHFALDRCAQEEPPLRDTGTGSYRCWLPEPPALTDAPDDADPVATAPVGRRLLQVRNLTVTYRRSGLLRRPSGKPAVDGISFDIYEGETLGLVGESGSGKSSTGRALMRLVPVTGGEMRYLDTDIARLSRRAYRDFAREVKIVFQDPMASLDPRMTIRELVEEPLRVHRVASREERERRVTHILSLVGLGTHFLDRYPHQLSGGQRQRVAVARSLVLSPRLIICDEPVSALDVSVQAQVINLLRDLRAELSLTYLFISHDLRVVRYLADRIAVMYQGRLVEIGSTEEVYHRPRHPYTQLLLASIPSLTGTPAPVDHARSARNGAATSGCAFAARCPAATDLCRQRAPALEPAGDSDVSVACHHWAHIREEPQRVRGSLTGPDLDAAKSQPS